MRIMLWPSAIAFSKQLRQTGSPGSGMPEVEVMRWLPLACWLTGPLKASAKPSSVMPAPSIRSRPAGLLIVRLSLT
ncbi:hypothetical protein D3C81_2014180 [compost metagenome]